MKIPFCSIKRNFPIVSDDESGSLIFLNWRAFRNYMIGEVLTSIVFNAY